MNLKQTKPATSADYKRIIENNLNINQTPTPRLLKRYEIERAFTAEDFKTLVSLYTPNPNDFAEVHKNADQVRQKNIREFLTYQERLDDQLQEHRATKTRKRGRA